ncbi:MAG TPA: chemotaxis protein CheW [Methylophilaceae bacterium]|jgi:twitching motility protein PilI
MARTKLNLQAYQQDILARLKSLSESGRAPASSKLGVKIGNVDWLISLADISEVLPVPEIMPVPLTQPWFMGMANVRGNLYALTDLAGYLGNPPTVVTSESRILLAHGQFGINSGLLVDRLIGLRNLEDMQHEKNVGDKPVWQLERYKDADGQIWDELDIGMLLTQSEFMQVAA